MTHAERIVKKLSKSEFIEVSNLLLRNSREDLERMLAGPGLPMFQELLISMYLKMGETGDYDAYDKHLNRLIGKVADEVKLNVKPTIIRRRNGEQVILGGEEVNEDEGNGNE